MQMLLDMYFITQYVDNMDNQVDMLYGNVNREHHTQPQPQPQPQAEVKHKQQQSDRE